jgi:hypothetical protein
LALLGPLSAKESTALIRGQPASLVWYAENRFPKNIPNLQSRNHITDTSYSSVRTLRASDSAFFVPIPFRFCNDRDTVCVQRTFLASTDHVFICSEIPHIYTSIVSPRHSSRIGSHGLLWLESISASTCRYVPHSIAMYHTHHA